MKRTEYKVCVRTNNGYPVYRRVLVDEKGTYFVKDENKLWNVTDRKKDFISITLLKG